MRPVTLTTLQTRVKQRANLEVASNAAIYSTSELNDNINEGLAELWDLMRESDSRYLPIKIAPFSTSNATDTYVIGQDIPAPDFMDLKGIDVTFGQNIVLTCKPAMNSERNRFKWYPAWIYSQPIWYRLEGRSLIFEPSPGGAFACNFRYRPIAPYLANSADYFDGVSGLEEYAVLHAARRLLIKQEQFEHAGAIAGLMGEMRDRIKFSAATADAESPERVQDVMLNDGWIGRPGY